MKRGADIRGVYGAVAAFVLATSMPTAVDAHVLEAAGAADSQAAAAVSSDEAETERRLRQEVERASLVGDVRSQSRASRALAEHLALTGRTARAADLLADMAVIDAALGEGDRDHLTTEYRLAQLELKAGRGAGAFARAARTRDAAETSLGPNDPLTLRLQAVWALAYADQNPFDGDGDFLDATLTMADAHTIVRTMHPDDAALRFDILSAYAEVLLMLKHTSMALPAVQDMVELMDQELAGDPGQRRRIRARLGAMVLEERFVRDALIILRQASADMIAARDTRSAQAELREGSPFRAMVQGAWIRSFDPEFGLRNDANLNRYAPELMGDFGVD